MGGNTRCSSQGGYEGNQVNVCEALRAGTNMHRGRQCRDMWGERHVKLDDAPQAKKAPTGATRSWKSKEESFPSSFQGELSSAETLIPNFQPLEPGESRFLLF